MNKPGLIALAIFVLAVVLNPEGTKDFIINIIAVFGRTLYDVICRLAI